MSSIRREYSKCRSMLIVSPTSVPCWMRVTCVSAAFSEALPRSGVGTRTVSPFLPRCCSLRTRPAVTRLDLYAAITSSLPYSCYEESDYSIARILSCALSLSLCGSLFISLSSSRIASRTSVLTCNPLIFRSSHKQKRACSFLMNR